MKSSIKLKHGKELAEIIKNPIRLAILVQVAFNTNEETGEAIINLPNEWSEEVGALVILGLLDHRDFKVFWLTNKKIVDITLKKTPSKSEIDNQDFRDAKIIPSEVASYYEIAKAFWDLFYANLTSINGRLYNLENAKFSKWLDPIRLMIENDGVTTDQLREVWQFLKKSDFWRDKVQSTQKLREKFNTLYNQLKSDEQRVNKTGANGGSGSRKTKVSTEYVTRVFNDLQS